MHVGGTARGQIGRMSGYQPFDFPPVDKLRTGRIFDMSVTSLSRDKSISSKSVRLSGHQGRRAFETLWFGTLAHSDFGFVSCFELRASDLPDPPLLSPDSALPSLGGQGVGRPPLQHSITPPLLGWSGSEGWPFPEAVVGGGVR
jgi:hypothetical protein